MTLISAYCGIEEIRGANCPESTLTEKNFSHYSASCTHVVFPQQLEKGLVP